MKNIKVNVRIRSEQSQSDSSPSLIDSYSSGEMEKMPNGWKIVYTEPQESNMQDSVTTLYVKGNEYVTMDRTGKHGMRMDFLRGKSHTSMLKTPYGDINIEFMTHKVRADISETGGNIFLSYLINYKDETPLKTILDIRIIPEGQVNI